MRKIHSIYCELYNQQIWLCLGSSKKHFITAVKTQANEEAETDFDFVNNAGYMVEYGDAIFIWLKNGDKSGLAPLAHESVHAATLILKARGVRLNPTNDEPLAYLTQWIFDSCLKHMRVK